MKPPHPRKGKRAAIWVAATVALAALVMSGDDAAARPWYWLYYRAHPHIAPHARRVPARRAPAVPEQVPLPVARPEAVPLPVARPEAVPLPVARPEAVPLPVARPEAVPLPVARPADNGPPAVTACQTRLASDRAVFMPLGDISGPGECGGSDIIELRRIIADDHSAIAVEPPAKLRCEMAEAIVAWAREDLASVVAGFGAALTRLENVDSYDCRGRNGVPGARLSEHGHANALDISALRLKSGHVVRLTDDAVPHEVRLAMRTATCSRFMTVLGPGSDGFHEDHIHVDLIQRAGGRRLCQWDLHDTPHPDATPELAAAAAPPVPLPRSRPVFLAAVVLHPHGGRHR